MTQVLKAVVESSTWGPSQSTLLDSLSSPNPCTNWVERNCFSCLTYVKLHCYASEMHSRSYFAQVYSLFSFHSLNCFSMSLLMVFLCTGHVAVVFVAAGLAVVSSFRQHILCLWKRFDGMYSKVLRQSGRKLAGWPSHTAVLVLIFVIVFTSSHRYCFSL